MAVDGDKLSVVAFENLPRSASALEVDSDIMGDELANVVLRKAGKGLHHARALPMASRRGLFGALVVLCKSEEMGPPERLELISALADLTAATFEKETQTSDLERSLGELRASRDLLARGYKLRALGEMAAGISHDMKNILNPLSLHLQIIERAIPADKTDAKKSVAEMRQVLHRGVDTLNRLREFSRQAPESRAEQVVLNQVAHEAVEICRPRLHSRHDVHVHVIEKLGEPPPVLVRSSEAVAALVNLIVNAVDALSEPGRAAKGTITVETGSIPASAKEPEQGFVRVSDDGPGMPEDVQRRVFEPFFTTKGKEGTGLGLAMVYAFVQRHAGTIELETKPGHGASFTLRFPGVGA
jgi:signal transduction histidine kinase